MKHHSFIEVSTKIRKLSEHNKSLSMLVSLKFTVAVIAGLACQFPQSCFGCFFLCYDACILNPFGVLERGKQVVLWQPNMLSHCYLIPLKLLNPGA